MATTVSPQTQQIVNQYAQAHGGLLVAPRAMVGMADLSLYSADQVQPDGSISDPYYEYRMADGTVLQVNGAGAILSLKEARAPAAGSAGPEPNVSTTAVKIPVYNPDTARYEWRDNPNFVPPAPRAAAKTPEQIAAESAANVDQSQAAAAASRANAASVETPDQRAARERGNILAQSDARAREERDKLQAQIDAGTILPEAAARQLEQTLKIEYAKLQAELKAADDAATFARNQPNVEVGQRQQQQGLDITAAGQQETGRHNLAAEESQRIQQSQQQARDQQAQREAAAKPLMDQSTLLQNQVFSAAQQGTAPTRGLADVVFSPLNMAFQLLGQGVQSGQVQPSQVPTPAAPVPGGQQQQSDALHAPVPGGA